jgi:anaerobic ribonucleoside-triphosphate reductase activating protein
MLNGEGLRVVLWLSGCDHGCKGCQNPITWNYDDGLEFDKKAEDEIFEALGKPYISGITFTGGDPLYCKNRGKVAYLIKYIRSNFPSKTIWIYTGYTWEKIHEDKYMPNVVENADVLVDGRYIEKLKKQSYHWAGSTNQRVIDIKKSIKRGGIILYECN